MIKQLDNIPTSLIEKKKSYRGMIRSDLQNAVDNRIDKFEIEGDYNYKYLAQYVRDEASRLFRNIYYSLDCDIRKKLSLEFGRRVFTKSAYEYERDFVKIHNIKGPDRYHVYVEMNFDFLDNLAEKIELDTRYKYQIEESNNELNTVGGQS